MHNPQQSGWYLATPVGDIRFHPKPRTTYFFAEEGVWSKCGRRDHETNRPQCIITIEYWEQLPDGNLE
jgi:hypothetical protein